MLILQNIWWLLVLIGVMILIHELGHYWAARIFDVRVETFSFGFGPRLFGFRKGETDFRFSLLFFFGGYVKMAGEQFSEEGASDPRGVLAKPRWQRLIIAFAGPFMNIVLAVGLLAGLFMFHYPKLPDVKSPTIGYVAPDSAAAKAGIREGDRIVQIGDSVDPTWEDVRMKEVASVGRAMHVAIDRNGQRLTFNITPVLDEKYGFGVAGWEQAADIEVAQVSQDLAAARAGLHQGDILVSVNGQPIRSTAKLHDVIKDTAGQAVTIVYRRDGQDHTVTIAPTKSNVDGQERWVIGVLLQQRMIITQLPFPQAVAASVDENVKSASMVYKFVEGIIERRMSAKSIEGPIRIAQLSGEAAREGPGPFVGLMSMVSLQLAIFNLMPIPILDGGVILLLLIEMVLRRDLSLQVKEAVIKVGFVFLMAVLMFALYSDITKIMQ